MKTKTNVALAMALVVAACPFGSASADAATGRITTITMHATYSVDRGACIRFSPEIPGTGWACLYKTAPTNHLYKEMHAALQSAALAGTVCTIDWIMADVAGHKVIQSITCTP